MLFLAYVFPNVIQHTPAADVIVHCRKSLLCAVNLQSDDFVDAFDTAQLVQPVEMRSTATRIFEEAKLACSNG